jgi:predicted metal-dependent hydrolase
MTAVDVRLEVGVMLFNRELFFEAHEVWEELWHETYGLNRNFFQGLIQVASAMHHLQVGNTRGARILYGSGMELLAPYGSDHLGLNLTDLKTRFTKIMEGLLDVPMARLSGRGGNGPIKKPYTSELAFALILSHGETQNH